MIRKLHEFCVEADVTLDEWMATCNFLVGAGQTSSDARNEVVLVSDVLGVESLVGARPSLHYSAHPPSLITAGTRHA